MIGRILTKLKEKEGSKVTKEQINEIWTSLQKMSSKMVTRGSPNLVRGAIAALKEVFRSNEELFFDNIHSSLKIFREIQHNLGSQKEVSMKSARYKIAEEIMELFTSMYSTAFIDSYSVLLDQSVITEVLVTLEVIIIQTNRSERSFTRKNPSKLLFEEKNIFEFYERLCIELKNQQASQSLIAEFLVDRFLDYNSDDCHLEAYCKRVLASLHNIIIQGFITHKETLFSLLPKLYKRIQFLINLRYDVEAA